MGYFMGNLKSWSEIAPERIWFPPWSEACKRGKCGKTSGSSTLICTKKTPSSHPGTTSAQSNSLKLELAVGHDGDPRSTSCPSFNLLYLAQQRSGAELFFAKFTQSNKLPGTSLRQFLVYLLASIVPLALGLMKSSKFRSFAGPKEIPSKTPSRCKFESHFCNP